MFRCDNQCSEKKSQFLAAGVGGDTGRWEIVHDQKCQKCYSGSLRAKGEKNTDKLEVETIHGAKVAPWKASEDVGKRTTRTRNVGILLPRTRKSKAVSRAG